VHSVDQRPNVKQSTPLMVILVQLRVLD